MKMLTIYKRELKSYFLSPLAYVLVGFLLLISGYFFATFVLSTQYALMSPVFGNMVFVFMFISPILTMKLISEEMKNGTDQLLMTSPLRITDMVLGKYFAALTVYTLSLVVSLIYPLYLKIYSTPDFGPILTGYIGTFLMGAAFIAIGIFASSLTENQLIAGVIGFSILLLFWIVSWLGDVFQGTAKNIVDNISLLQRFTNFQNGVLSLNDVVFYLSVIIFFVFVTIMVVDKRRWS
ncbi:MULTISPECIES: ABC transporter permease [Thermoanaerobacterium]|uniref:ABC transporter n=2 Tax=Thermoanaerobacterium TaxID=28895 RepID=W9E7L0_9THEO|nr:MULTISPECIES: ABC transporter permease [Thermoanaerobacterium]AFK86234.1 ABC-2 type transporter [Thermoanaerobacterium saccharolyticum JW/SL-YS485]ETO37422.1 ABC transporter [Thermoanaerobacterium aotearoense SCUT27]